MKVLFLGHTGVRKSLVLRSLAEFSLGKQGFPADVDNINTHRFLRVYHLEHEIAEQTGGNYIPFLDQFYAKIQAATWLSAWQRILTNIDSSPSENTFIAFHATYFRQNRFFSAMNLECIKEFEPNVIFTLIDDAQDCWYRIKERESEHPQGTNLRLRDILLWRTVEIMAADYLASLTGAKHYVLAVKHPLQMAYRLLFDSHFKRVYASFPISSTRNSAELRDLVDDFRKQLHERFIVFDPLTLDERTIRSARDRHRESQRNILISVDDRWPLIYPDGYSPMLSPDDVQYPIEIPLEEVQEVLTDIDSQIRARDYRLIDQVNVVTAFRPSLRGHHSRGVISELQYAAQTVGIPVHVLWDSDEDGDFNDSPFTAGGVQHVTIEGLIQAVN